MSLIALTPYPEVMKIALLTGTLTLINAGFSSDTGEKYANLR